MKLASPLLLPLALQRLKRRRISSFSQVISMSKSQEKHIHYA